MKRRSAAYLLGHLPIVTVLFFCPVLHALAAEKPIVLKASGAWPQTSESTAVYFKFFEIVKGKSKGRLELKWIGGPEFIKERDLPMASASGTIDVFQCSQGYLAGSVPEGAIADAYPIGRSYQTAYQVYYDILKIVSPLFQEKLRVKPIGQTLFFPFFLWTKHPVTTMQNIRGLKIRGHGGLVPFIISELGGAPMTTATTEVYVSLERGIIDGAVRNLPAYNSFKEYELAPYGVSVPVTWATADVFVSRKAWDSLPKELQDVLWQAGEETTKYNAEYWKKMDNVFMQKFSEQKVTFFEPQPDMKAAWLKAIREGGAKGAKKLSPSNSASITSVFDKFAE